MQHGPAQQTQFPNWYTWVKWGVPIGLGAVSALLLGLVITGAFAPLGAFNAATSFYAGLYGFPALTFLGSICGAAAALVGLAASLIVRTALFTVTEQVANDALNENKHLADQLQQVQQQLGEAKDTFDNTIAKMDDQRISAFAQLNQLRGETGRKPISFRSIQEINEKSKKAAAKDAANADDENLDEVDAEEAPKPKRRRVGIKIGGNA
jgi:hypothetical protein